MAKIWFGYQGDKAPRGEPIAVKSLRWCADELGLTKQNWKCIPHAPPMVSKDKRLPNPDREPVAVIIEVDSFDLIGSYGWQTGYYVPALRPEAVGIKLRKNKFPDRPFVSDTRK